MNTLNSLRHLYSLVSAQQLGTDNDELIRQLLDEIAPRCTGLKSKGLLRACWRAYQKRGACAQMLVEIENLGMLAKKR